MQQHASKKMKGRARSLLANRWFPYDPSCHQSEGVITVDIQFSCCVDRANHMQKSKYDPFSTSTHCLCILGLIDPMACTNYNIKPFSTLSNACAFRALNAYFHPKKRMVHEPIKSSCCSTGPALQAAHHNISSHMCEVKSLASGSSYLFSGGGDRRKEMLKEKMSAEKAGQEKFEQWQRIPVDNDVRCARP